MRRTTLVLTAAAIMVTMLMISALPALAQSVTTPPVESDVVDVGPGEVDVGGVTPPPINNEPINDGPLIDASDAADVGDVNVGPLTGDGDQPLSDVTVQCVADPLIDTGGGSAVPVGGESGDQCADDGGSNEGGDSTLPF